MNFEPSMRDVGPAQGAGPRTESRALAAAALALTYGATASFLVATVREPNRMRTK